MFGQVYRKAIRVMTIQGKYNFEAFYSAFEEEFRGPREQIKSRLRVYLPFVLPLQSSLAPAHVVDLGCGRGEWLELMRESGFDARGIDLDGSVVARCRKYGLDVHQGGALGFLQDLPDESQAVVASFHVIEHIPFTELHEWVREAARVLKPGGLVIFETQNPENLLVGSSSFYLDPTHQRPIPPRLLGSLFEHLGYQRVKVLRLQESSDIATNPAPSLYDVLTGVSPDYAVVARKHGPAASIEVTEAAFGVEYGLTLDVLAKRYQRAIDARLAQAEARVARAEARMAPVQRLGYVLSNIHALASRSGLKALLGHVAGHVSRHPRLRKAALAILDRLPNLKSRLFHFLDDMPMPLDRADGVTASTENLPPHARRIHASLKSVIERARNRNG